MAEATVREIMTLPVLRGTSVLAGAAGVDRPVTGVNVMEVPDIEAFVKSGELLLTTAYPVRERPERLVELLPVLAARGLAALAVKPMRYLDRFPDRLVAVADELAFPVLVLPDDTSFNDVIGAVLAVVLAEYGAEPARAEAIRERLTGVALAGGGLQEIARTLAGALDREVVVVDGDDEVLGRSGRVPTGDAPTPWAFPITVAGAHRGQLLVGGRDEPTLGQRRLIRQACFAAGMYIAQAMASLELDRRLRVVFLEDLVTRPDLDEQIVRQRSRLYGWETAAPSVVLLARGPSELSDAAVAAQATAVLSPRAVAWSRGREVVAIVPHDALVARSDLLDRWRLALDALGAGGTVVAVGATAATTFELSASHATAHEALTIAEATGRTVARQDELAMERLLLAVPRDTLAAFVDATIGPLTGHDLAHGTDLRGTLGAYLNLGNGAEAARRLYIHYNTFKHRMAQVSELVGERLHEPRGRLALALALEARKLL
jgi:purine catabolism regulator